MAGGILQALLEAGEMELQKAISSGSMSILGFASNFIQAVWQLLKPSLNGLGSTLSLFFFLGKSKTWDPSATKPLEIASSSSENGWPSW